MECTTCKEQLSEYLDDELGADDAASVAAHLESCEACRRELARLEEVAALTAELPTCEPATDVVLQIAAAFREAAPPSRRTEFGAVLDIDELAEFLRVDANTVGIYLEDIPCFELGGKLLFRRQAVEEWIEKREKTHTYAATGTDSVASEPANVITLEVQNG